MRANSSQNSPLSIILIIAVTILSISTVTFGVLYAQASHEIDTQKAAMGALQANIATEASHAAELTSNLTAARTNAQILAIQSAQLASEVKNKQQDLAAATAKAESTQEQLEQEKARLPAVPVRIQMRPSAMGRGLVAMFTNTSARHLSLLMESRNPTTEATKQLSLQVAPGLKVEIGYREGVQFASGDEVVLRSAGYEDLGYIVQ